jgi:pimeloyl-ACP methyl ester carboxylesterase
MKGAPPMLALVNESTGTSLSNGVVVDLQTHGSGPELLLLHGGEGARADGRFIDELAKRFTVIVPTHPGFGLSPSVPWLTSVDDLAYLYLDLLATRGSRSVTLVGLQFGGWIAAEMAVRDCSRLGSLVLVDSVGVKIGGREDRDIADIFAMSRDEVNRRRFASAASNPVPDLKTAAREDVLHVARNEEALVSFAWTPYMHNPKLLRWLSRISVPTAVVWGAQDGIVSADYGRALAKAIPGAAFHLVADAGHCAQIDQPSAIAALVNAANPTR